MIGLLCLMWLSACSSSEEKEIIKAKPRAVRIERIVNRDLPVMVRSVGRLVPNREVVISAQVTGILKALHADVGSKVKSGEPLAKLDPLDYTLALNEALANLLSAKAGLSAAERAYDRVGRLLPEKTISQELFDRAEAEYRIAQARVSQLKAVEDIARRRLAKTVINAPFNGYVTQRFVELGQNVAVGEPVMSIADMETMRVEIHVNENDYVHLDQNDPVSVVIETFSNTPLSGRLDKIGIKADPRTNTFEVEILLNNPQFTLKGGLTSRVSIQTEMIPDAVVIPQESVLFREDRKEVFVVEQGGIAAVREVKLGRVDGSSIRILEGLMPGDDLVVAGGQYLKPGDEVMVIP